VLVALEPDQARARLAATDAPADRLEQAGSAFFERVHAAYEQLAQRWPERIARVDGADDADTVERRVDEALAPTLQRAGIELAPLSEGLHTS
jgi:thymidylate kinase